MCKCTPSIRTPYCGKGDCVWPKSTKPENAREADDTLEQAVIDFLAALDHAHFVSKRTTGHGPSLPTHTWQEEHKAWIEVHAARARIDKFLNTYDTHVSC